MAGRTVGMDLGTKVIKLYKKGEGVILDEQNVIALAYRSVIASASSLAAVAGNTGKKTVLAVGNEAAEMSEKAPQNIEVIYPVKNGVIADIKNMQLLFNRFFSDLHGKTKINGLDFLIAIPTDITEVEKRAFIDLVLSSNAKPRKISLVDKPICVALGAGLDVTNARGVMTVDIGADTTEVSIMSLGGIVLSKLINVGGNKIDSSIKLYVKKKYGLYIGDRTAEMIKKELASAFPTEEKVKKVYGRDVVSGLPIEVEISSDMVYNSIKEHLRTIVDAIRIILERTPPEISSDIIDSGIYVTGGSANIYNLDKLFHDETELKINIVPKPDDAVVSGLGAIMENENYETLPYMYRQTEFLMRSK